MNQKDKISVILLMPKLIQLSPYHIIELNNLPNLIILIMLAILNLEQFQQFPINLFLFDFLRHISLLILDSGQAMIIIVEDGVVGHE
jgi:hypothetical protein